MRKSRLVALLAVVPVIIGVLANWATQDQPPEWLKPYLWPALISLTVVLVLLSIIQGLREKRERQAGESEQVGTGVKAKGRFGRLVGNVGRDYFEVHQEVHHYYPRESPRQHRMPETDHNLNSGDLTKERNSTRLSRTDVLKSRAKLLRELNLMASEIGNILYGPWSMPAQTDKNYARGLLKKARKHKADLVRSNETVLGLADFFRRTSSPSQVQCTEAVARADRFYGCLEELRTLLDDFSPDHRSLWDQKLILENEIYNALGDTNILLSELGQFQRSIYHADEDELRNRQYLIVVSLEKINDHGKVILQGIGDMVSLLESVSR